jgi:hypothetical protein
MNDQEAVDPRHLLMIVVGAHLEAELADRPLGYRLQNDVVRWQQETPEADPLGRPEHNAVSAYFANRLPTALVIDRSLQVQLDPEFVTLQACVWGVDEPATRSGVDLFVERYLEPFLRSAHSL